MTLRGHIVIPVEKDGATKTVEQIKARLTTSFGGISVYEGIGTWSASAKVVEEQHKRLVVTSKSDELLKEALRAEAERVKEELDEDAVLVEFEDVEMELI